MKCKSCEIEKEENDFYKGSRVCKKCRIQLIKEWKKNNPEKVKASVKKRRKECHGEILERERKYREDNREKVNQAATRYREANREKCRERSLKSSRKKPEKRKEYRENNREKHREYSRKYTEANREKINEKKRKKNSEDRVHATIEGRARKQVWNATKKGILTRPKRCQMCSVECKLEAHHADYNRPLEVIWVCRLCHGGIHIALRKN